MCPGKASVPLVSTHLSQRIRGRGIVVLFIAGRGGGCGPGRGGRNGTSLSDELIKERHPRRRYRGDQAGDRLAVLADLECLTGLDPLKHLGRLLIELAHRHRLHTSHSTTSY